MSWLLHVTARDPPPGVLLSQACTFHPCSTWTRSPSGFGEAETGKTQPRAALVNADRLHRTEPEQLQAQLLMGQFCLWEQLQSKITAATPQRASKWASAPCESRLIHEGIIPQHQARLCLLAASLVWEIPSFPEHSWQNSFFWVFEMPPSPLLLQYWFGSGEGMHEQEPPQSSTGSGVPILEPQTL